MSNLKCSKCGHEIDLVKEDAWMKNDLPECEKCHKTSNIKIANRSKNGI